MKTVNIELMEKIISETKRLKNLELEQKRVREEFNLNTRTPKLKLITGPELAIIDIIELKLDKYDSFDESIIDAIINKYDYMINETKVKLNILTGKLEEEMLSDRHLDDGK